MLVFWGGLERDGWSALRCVSILPLRQLRTTAVRPNPWLAGRFSVEGCCDEHSLHSVSRLSGSHARSSITPSHGFAVSLRGAERKRTGRPRCIYATEVREDFKVDQGSTTITHVCPRGRRDLIRFPMFSWAQFSVVAVLSVKHGFTE